jgi:hypothetical protein
MSEQLIGDVLFFRSQGASLRPALSQARIDHYPCGRFKHRLRAAIELFLPEVPLECGEFPLTAIHESAPAGL